MWSGLLEAPASYNSRSVSIPQQAPKHANHVNSSSPVNSLHYLAVLPQVIFVRSASGNAQPLRIHKFHAVGMENHGRASWKSTSS
jgi:hypothetical protein